MSKQKPVWRMNAGQVVPSDLGGKFITANGYIKDIRQDNMQLLDRLGIFIIDGCALDIYAYQTNRVKAAKFEREHCWPCDGFGYLKHRGLDCCPNCNGTGLMARRIK